MPLLSENNQQNQIKQFCGIFQLNLKNPIFYSKLSEIVLKIFIEVQWPISHKFPWKIRKKILYHQFHCGWPAPKPAARQLGAEEILFGRAMPTVCALFQKGWSNSNGNFPWFGLVPLVLISILSALHKIGLHSWLKKLQASRPIFFFAFAAQLLLSPLKSAQRCWWMLCSTTVQLQPKKIIMLNFNKTR